MPRSVGFLRKGTKEIRVVINPMMVLISEGRNLWAMQIENVITQIPQASVILKKRDFTVAPRLRTMLLS